MLRYKQLLKNSLDPAAAKPMSLRKLARAQIIPVPSVHNYIEFNTLPRIENIKKMATYYNESVSSLFSEDNDTTAELITTIRKLSITKQRQILKELKP